MMLKRLDAIRPSVVALGLTALLSAAADAQLVDGKWRMPPSGSTGRKGVMVDPPPQPPPPFPANPSFPSNPQQQVQPVAFTLVPAIIMSDGSIFANFGFGFEPVLRPCGGVVVTGQVRRVASNGVVLSEPRQTQTTSTLSSVAQSACFSRDAAGRVFVYRRS